MIHTDRQMDDATEALERAMRKGRISGLREAAEMAEDGLYGRPGAWERLLAGRLRELAERLEKEADT